uniref:Uncharacterized protein n=1 Tax=Anopheles farauti TaxID=69004 RepID=A0A182QV68_9DIPT
MFILRERYVEGGNMLKWVVTRGPHALPDGWKTSKDTMEGWMWNKENHPPDVQMDVANNNNVHATKPTALTGPSTPIVRNERKRTAAKLVSLESTASPASLSNTSANNTVSSFRYFLVNSHSSPLKRLNQPIGDSSSSLYAKTTPLASGSPRYAANHRRTVQQQRSRRRLSSLHIREPTEMASPSYRPADDPANDLTSDLLLPTPDRKPSTEWSPTPQWQQVWEIFATENEQYNEREIKTPETESCSVNISYSTIPNAYTSLWKEYGFWSFIRITSGAIQRMLPVASNSYLQRSITDYVSVVCSKERFYHIVDAHIRGRIRAIVLIKRARMTQACAVPTGSWVDDTGRALGIRQQHMIECAVHVALAADRGHFIDAPLMEPIVALVAVESGKQQTPTALAERKGKERFPDELMRNVLFLDFQIVQLRRKLLVLFQVQRRWLLKICKLRIQRVDIFTGHMNYGFNISKILLQLQKRIELVVRVVCFDRGHRASYVSLKDQQINR